MGLSCGDKLLKFLMFFMNFIFWVVGATLLGVGIWLAVDDNIGFLDDIMGDSNPMDDSLWSVAVYATIAIGAFVFLLGFLGCCGACTQNSCMLCLYQVIVTVVLIAEVVCVILVAVYWSDLDDEFDNRMLESVLERYGTDNEDVTTRAQDDMQQELECCGARNYLDYKNSTWYRKQLEEGGIVYNVPKSCCDVDQEEGKDMNEYMACSLEAASGNSDYDKLYDKGCTEELKDWIEDNAIIFIAVVGSFVGLQILGLIFACCLKSSFDKMGDAV